MFLTILVFELIFMAVNEVAGYTIAATLVREFRALAIFVL